MTPCRGPDGASPSPWCPGVECVLTPPGNGESVRERIREVVEAEPGIHKSSLQRDLGIGWGNLTHHIQILEQQGHLTTLQKGRRVHLFGREVAEDARDLLASLRGGAMAVAELLSSRDAADVDELAAELGIGRKAVRRHLTGLRDQGLSFRSDGRGRWRMDESEWGAALHALREPPE